MAWALIVDKLDPGGKITVRHTFYGETQRECQELRDQHGEGCKAFGPALREDRIIEIWDELDELPEWED